MSDKQKNIMYALGAGAALVGAALIYHFVSKTSVEDDDAVPQLEVDSEFIAEELKKSGLDQIVRGANNTLENNYFLKLLQFVGAETREQSKERRAYLTKQRREAYKKEDWEAYQECVSKAVSEEDIVAQKILVQILESIGLAEQEFAYTHQRLAQDPQFAEFVMAAQQGKLA
jgi:predicted ATP-binding protein involved in virulence